MAGRLGADLFDGGLEAGADGGRLEEAVHPAHAAHLPPLDALQLFVNDSFTYRLLAQSVIASDRYYLYIGLI